MTSPHVLVEILGQMPAERAQNRLLASSDRDLGLVILHMSPDDRDMVMRYVGPAKAKRLADEILRLKHVRFDRVAYEVAMAHLISHLKAAQALKPLNVWFRPSR